MDRSIICLSILFIFTTFQAVMCTVSPDAKTFFSNKINGNLTKITWAHAVNSQAELQNVLDSSDDIMMVEADVVLGTHNATINGTAANATKDTPIMAHPPKDHSDLSLDEFLEKLLSNGTRGIKLDFKSIEALEGSKAVLKKYYEEMTVPIWINADILPGPINASTMPVEANRFFAAAVESVPECTLSIGWTTNYGSDKNVTEGYSAAQVDTMLKAVGENNVLQPITYAVRAGLAANDINVLKTLINNSTANNATLTIWSSKGDYVNTDNLSKLIKDIGIDKVYVDVPQDIWQKLSLSSASGIQISSVLMLVSVTALFLKNAVNF